MKKKEKFDLEAFLEVLHLSAGLLLTILTFIGVLEPIRCFIGIVVFGVLFIIESALISKYEDKL